MALLMVVGILASIVTWIPGPSRGLLLAGREGCLPPWLQRTNGKGMQVNIMVVQGAIVTVLALFFALSPSVQGALWIFSAIAVQLAFVIGREDRESLGRFGRTRVGGGWSWIPGCWSTTAP